MLKSREYIGLSLEGDFLKIARVKPHKNGLQLLRLDKLKLVEPIKARNNKSGKITEPVENLDELDSTDSIFGIDDYSSDNDPVMGDDFDERETDTFDFDADTFPKSISGSDLVDEASMAQSNVELLVKYLDDFSKRRVNLALNVEIGSTTYQIINGQNYNQLKEKEVRQHVKEKLEAIHGYELLEDNYDYVIDKKGNLIVASIDEEPHALQLLNDAMELYNMKHKIKDVVPDESAMVGLFREHYEEKKGSITVLLQFGPEKCKMVFLDGHEIVKVSPVIHEGTESKNFLNTIFSKILFQLDTGGVSNIDQFIFFNNSVGEKANNYFVKHFEQIPCEDFTFNSKKLYLKDSQKEIVSGFTTAIGIASAAALNGSKKHNDGLSFLPDYIKEKQNLFRLQWHGLVLLILIGFTPIVLNHFYQINANEIDQLRAQESRLELMIEDLRPLVAESEQLNTQIAALQDQLTLLTDLTHNNRRWIVTMDKLNSAVEQNEGIWISSFRQNGDALMADGFSLTRVGIPNLSNEFPEITLMSVRKMELRDRSIYNFNLMIHRPVEDETLFTPEQTREIELTLSK